MMKEGNLQHLKGRKNNGKSKYDVNVKHCFFLFGVFPKLCLRVEAKVIILLDVVLNAYRKRFKPFINGGE